VGFESFYKILLPFSILKKIIFFTGHVTQMTNCTRLSMTAIEWPNPWPGLPSRRVSTRKKIYLLFHQKFFSPDLNNYTIWIPPRATQVAIVFRNKKQCQSTWRQIRAVLVFRKSCAKVNYKFWFFFYKCFFLNFHSFCTRLKGVNRDLNKVDGQRRATNDGNANYPMESK
jgi:hypothetical protein